MTTVDQPVCLGADLCPHHQTIPGVHRRAAHFGLVPIAAHPRAAQIGAGFKTATGEDHRVRCNLFVANPHTCDRPVLGQQTRHGGIVAYDAAQPREGPKLHLK